MWLECKDRKTLALLLMVIVVMYFPVWGGYMLHALFDWGWCSAVASAYLLFWAGPFTPFFPVCIAITLAIKRFLRYRSTRKKERSDKADEYQITPRPEHGKTP